MADIEFTPGIPNEVWNELEKEDPEIIELDATGARIGHKEQIHKPLGEAMDRIPQDGRLSKEQVNRICLTRMGAAVTQIQNVISAADSQKPYFDGADAAAIVEQVKEALEAQIATFDFLSGKQTPRQIKGLRGAFEWQVAVAEKFIKAAKSAPRVSAASVRKALQFHAAQSTRYIDGIQKGIG